MKKKQAFQLGLAAAEVIRGFESLSTGATIRAERERDGVRFVMSDGTFVLHRRVSATTLQGVRHGALHEVGRVYAREWLAFVLRRGAVTVERRVRHDVLYSEPVQQAIDNAPRDDEPTTRQDNEAIERGKEDIAVPSDEVKAKRKTCIPMWRTLVVRIEELNLRRLSARTAEGYRRLNGEYREARAELYRLATNGKELEL